jgi:hypothetical protein
MAEQPTPPEPHSDPRPAQPGGVDAKEAGITAGGNVTLHAGGNITGRDSYGDIGTKIDAPGGHVEVHIGEGAPARPQRRRPPPTVPALPTQFVDRPDLLARAKQALLQPEAGAGQAARMVGLVGMGGSGKSILANALAHDPHVVQAFPDGIVRLEFGQHPELLAQQARLASLLGDLRPIVDILQGLDRLNELLDGARLLLVLDNVWDDGYFRAFRLLQPGCALLVTTRDLDTLDRAATAIPVGFLPDDQALKLLAAWAGQDPTSLPEEASQVAGECGGLPLALAVAGGMVADGRSWHNVHQRLRRADLDKLRARFGDYPYPDLLRALEASVTGLGSEERARYLELAVFDGQGQVPDNVVLWWWWAQAGLDELAAEDLFWRLVRRSLVQHDPASNSLSMHDLQFDYIRRELGPNRVRELHLQMATALLDRWGGLEERLPKLQAMRSLAMVDQYGLGRCVQHLVAGDQADTMHRLLMVDWPTPPSPERHEQVDNAWYLAHERADQPAAYLRDIRLAWQLAERATHDALLHGELATSIGLELRYALITASIVSVAARIPPALLVALVNKQLWTPARAFTYASQIPNPDTKAEALAGLAPHLPEPDRHTALSDALTAIRTIDPYHQAQALAGLAPHLSPNQLATALDLARTLGFSDARARALAGLVASLPESERPEVVAEVLATPPDYSQYMRADALADLVPPSPPALLPRILAAAHDLDDPQGRTLVMTALVQASAGRACLAWEPHWRSELAAAASKGRAHVTADLAAIHSVVADVGGQTAVASTCHTVVDVARWWP